MNQLLYRLLENLRCSSPASNRALEYPREFIYYCIHVFHCSPRTEHVQQISRKLARGPWRPCPMLHTALPHDPRSHPHLIFLDPSRRDKQALLIAHWVYNFTIPYSEHHQERKIPCSSRFPHSKHGYCRSKADGWNLNPKSTAGGGSRAIGMRMLSQSILGVASCTTTWGFSVARQKAESCVVCTTSSRGEPVVFGLISTIILTTIFPFQTSHSIIATHPFETAREPVLPL